MITVLSHSFLMHTFIHSPRPTFPLPPPPFQIAAKVAAPLAKTNEIIIMTGDGSRVTSEVTRLLAELPVTVNALTGVDLSKVRLPAVNKGRKGFQDQIATVH